MAALELPGVSDACYSLQVHNTTHAPGTPFAADTLVWEKTDICANRYGDSGGAITYIGTCDASPVDPLNPAPRDNTVSLVLDGLCREAGCALGVGDPDEIAPGTYQNPCPATAPCELVRPCQENADTLVEFNLTIMRDAQQGFFDVAVNFSDIFCSAKLDCVGNLLHDADDARAPTVVLGFACTAGTGAESCLYVNDVRIDCTNDAYDGTIPMSSTPGNINLPADTSILFGAATYQGDEQLPGLEKSYFNVALGIDPDDFAAAGNCDVIWSGTASEGALGNTGGVYSTAPATSYPIVKWSRRILTAGALACTTHPLNGTDDTATGGADHSGVATAYTDIALPFTFTHERCNEADDVPEGDPNNGSDPGKFTDLGTAAKGVDASNFVQNQQNGFDYTNDHQLGVDTYADGIDARDCFKASTDDGEYVRFVVIPVATGDELQVQIYTALDGSSPLETYVANDAVAEYPDDYGDLAASTFYPQLFQYACVSRTANSSAAPVYLIAAVGNQAFPGGDTNNHAYTADSINGQFGNAPDNLTSAGAFISVADEDDAEIGGRLDQTDYFSFTFDPPSGGLDQLTASCSVIAGVTYEVRDSSDVLVASDDESITLTLTSGAHYFFVVHADPGLVGPETAFSCTLGAQ